MYHTSAKDKIRALRIVNELSSKSLENYLKSVKERFREKVNGLDKKARSEYDIYELNLSDISRQNVGLEKYQIKHPKVARIVDEETEMYTLRENVRRSLREMILVYTIVIFEEFLTNTLIALFTKQPEILKSSQKTITYEQLLKHVSMNELLNTISNKKVKHIIDKDIDCLGKYLCEAFHLDLTQQKDWKRFKEFFYRRNIIVHNYGRPDSLYNSKTGKNLSKDDWLEIDERYLVETFNTFEKYADLISSFFHNKYGKKTKR